MFSYICMLYIGLVSYDHVENVNSLVTLQSSNVMPTVGNGLTLSCLIQDVVNDNSITWYVPKSIIGTAVCFRQSGFCTSSTQGYTYTANQSGAYLDIASINRDQDEGIWKCSYRGSNGMDTVRTLNITVYNVNAQVTLQSNNVMPTQGNSLTLSCLIQDVVNDNTISWYVPKSITVRATCFRQSGFCEGSTPGYTYTANQSGAYLDVTSLNRDQDEGIWKCSYRGSDGMDTFKTLNITVYSLPSQLVYTKDVQAPTDLSVSNLTLQCKTSDCTYPAPYIKWYYRTQTSPIVSGLYSVGIGMTSSDSLCSSQEKLYTSTLQIPLYTTWSDNSDKKVTFYCGTDYPDPSRNIQSTYSGTVRFAVAVTSVTLNISASEVVFYEGYPQILTCISSPSRPISTISWFLGSRPLTGNITITNTIDTTGLYILTSRIFLTLMRDASNQQIKCEGFISGQQAVTSLEKPSVNVWYAPDVKVTLTGSNQQNQTAILICEAQGIPAQYTFYTWVQMWEDMVVRTELQGTTSASQNTITIDRLSLESMGTYVCSVNNGITGINGNINQTGSASVNITGMPNILDDNVVFFGEIGMLVNISIPFYSNPVIENFVIQRNGTEIINNSRTMTFLTWDLVNYSFYGSMVKLKAQKAYFIIQKLEHGDFDNYTLGLRNSISKTVFRFQLDAFGPPLTVHRFYFNRFIDNQIELHFDPGFNGGLSQTFVIEESAVGSNGIWQNASVTNLQDTEWQNQFKNGTFFVNITKPVIPGIYQYRMYSWNIKGKSEFSKSITVTVPEVPNIYKSSESSVAGIAGGVSAGIVIILGVVIGIFLWRRNLCMNKNEHVTDKDIKREQEVSTRQNQASSSPLKQDVASGKEYEGLHFTDTEVNQYLELNVMTSANTGNSDKRSPESDSYEKLHPYANNDIQMYSTLKIPAKMKDSQKVYENAG